MDSSPEKTKTKLSDANLNSYKGALDIIHQGSKTDSARLDVIQYLTAISGIYGIAEHLDLKMSSTRIALSLLILSILFQLIDFLIAKRNKAVLMDLYLNLIYRNELEDKTEEDRLLAKLRISDTDIPSLLNRFSVFNWLQLALLTSAIVIVAAANWV